MWAQILCYKNQGIHWYHCNPTFLWKINALVRRQISALIWVISGLWNRSDDRDYREKGIVISRFLALYLKISRKLWNAPQWLFMMHYGNQCHPSKLMIYTNCACRKWLIVICSVFFILSWKPQQKIMYMYVEFLKSSSDFIADTYFRQAQKPKFRSNILNKNI